MTAPNPTPAPSAPPEILTALQNRLVELEAKLQVTEKKQSENPNFGPQIDQIKAQIAEFSTKLAKIGEISPKLDPISPKLEPQNVNPTGLLAQINDLFAHLDALDVSK